jgi:hypothetical protein
MTDENVLKGLSIEADTGFEISKACRNDQDSTIRLQELKLALNSVRTATFPPFCKILLENVHHTNP